MLSMRLMECVADWVIRLRKGVIAVFAVLSVVFGVCALTVSINYDMTDYLPPEANSTKGIAEMKRSFGMELPNTTVMVKADSLTEGLAIKTKLAEADGVTDVMWLDDVVDVKQPLAVQDQDTVEAYYKNGQALYSVTVESGKEQQGVEAIRRIVGQDGAIIGNAVDQASSKQMALGESARAVVLLLPVLLIILFVSTRSWIEPLLYLICIGVGSVINLGISGVKGQMCFLTLAVVPILQLAVALDYAVFLSTAYNAAREHTKNAKAAVKGALISSSTSIFASALVGVFAFAALVAMKFQIGPDMGWALVRGVIISYLSVITFLPALIMSCDRLIQRTHHRSFLPRFMSVGRGVVKARIPLLMVVVALVVPSYMAQSMNSFIYGTGEAAPGTQIARDTEKIEQTFNNSNQLVLLVPLAIPVQSSN